MKDNTWFDLVVSFGNVCVLLPKFSKPKETVTQWKHISLCFYVTLYSSECSSWNAGWIVTGTDSRTQEGQLLVLSTNYFSSKGVFTKYVVSVPLPLTYVGPLHSHSYPAPIRILAVLSVTCIIDIKGHVRETATQYIDISVWRTTGF